MDNYAAAAHTASRAVTLQFSTSFGMASRLFPREVRCRIYDIYGLVRIADEIVDTYEGADRNTLLDRFEADTYAALERGYSTDVIIHAFQETAREVGIGRDVLEPFFESMRMDVAPELYTTDQYAAYIHGSAEVIGLMCLRVFCRQRPDDYSNLQAGASALGAAFQKVNFLRDLADDYQRLGRYYFPVGSFDAFDDSVRDEIVADIMRDFDVALPAVRALPPGVRPAVVAATQYYEALLRKLAVTPATKIKHERIRLSDYYKLWLLGGALVGHRIPRLRK